MPKLYLPPQGGEKWLCIFTFLFMMFRSPWPFIAASYLQLLCIFSVLCTVIIIYCIVIIYIPSMKENGTEFQVRFYFSHILKGKKYNVLSGS